MRITKNIRLMVLLVIILASVYLTIVPFLGKPKGVKVVSIDENASCGSLKEGDIITQLSFGVVENKEDFEKEVKNVKAGERVTLVVNGGPGGCVALRDGYLGINVSDLKKAGLKFSTEIAGGSITYLQPKKSVSSSELERIRDKLLERARISGFPEVRAEISAWQVKIYSLKDENINLLRIKGRFEAKILEKIDVENDSIKVFVGEKSYSIEVKNNSLILNGTDNKFELDGISFEVKNITNSSVYLEAFFFGNEDVTSVFDNLAYTRYNPNAYAYEFYLPVEISEEASERFEKITKMLTSRVVSGQPVLNAPLVYYLDGEAINTLNIPFEMTTKKVKNIAILGFRNTYEEANNINLKLQEALKTGEIPELEIVKLEAFEGKYQNLFSYTIIGTLIGLAILSSSLALKTKKVKACLASFLLSSSQILPILGAISIVQSRFEHGWIIDIPTVFGISLAVFLTFLKILILTEEKEKNKKISLCYKHEQIIGLNNLLTIVFTLISFVLLFTPFKGFGLSLIIASLISLFLIEPCYLKILS